MSALTTKDFVSRAKKRHGDRFNYKHTEYAGAKDPLRIYCREHGVFSTKPGAHLGQNGGCRDCFKQAQSDRKIKYTRKTFIHESKLKFGSAFSYESVKEEIGGVLDEIVLTCRKHGEFRASICDHLRSDCGSCRSCFGISNGERQGSNESSFLRRSARVHGSKYNYSKVVFQKMQREVEILCKEHGSFWQLPKVHVRGHGCPDCYYTSGNRKYQRKDYLLNGKTHRVLGYENIAIDYILAKGLAKPREIELKRVPKFRYKHEGKYRRYYPDAFVPKQNRVVEVKSPYTLIADFEVLKLKRKAVIKSGCKFSLLVFSGTGERAVVPREWFNLSAKHLKSLI